jgi:hypothetical protein
VVFDVDFHRPLSQALEKLPRQRKL